MRADDSDFGNEIERKKSVKRDGNRSSSSQESTVLVTIQIPVATRLAFRTSEFTVACDRVHVLNPFSLPLPMATF